MATVNSPRKVDPGENWKLGGDRLIITFESWHTLEWTDNPLHVQVVWDDFKDKDAFLAISPEFALQAYQAKLAAEGIEDISPEKIPDTNFCMAESSLDAWDAKFTSFMKYVMEQAKDVGGDDTYFDYYPDLFFIADQIAPALDKVLKTGKYTLMVKAARQHAYNVRYWDLEPETLLSEVRSQKDMDDQLKEFAKTRNYMIRRGLLREVEVSTPWPHKVVEVVSPEEYEKKLSEKGLARDGD